MCVFIVIFDVQDQSAVLRIFDMKPQPALNLILKKIQLYFCLITGIMIIRSPPPPRYDLPYSQITSPRAFLCLIKYSGYQKQPVKEMLHEKCTCTRS